MRIPVVMDCDPGIDDAVALLMAAAAPNIELRAVTTVAGNQGVETNTKNALKITDYFGIDVPVAQGMYPIMKQFQPAAAWINGETGLGGANLPEPERSAVSGNAVELLYKEAIRQNGKLQILATGPLTNVALLLCTFPKTRKLVSRITLMGGACSGGNVTPCAEFNIYTDPEAARIVFHSGVPITMVGLDACYRTPVSKEEFSGLIAVGGRASAFLRDLLGPSAYCERTEKGMILFDALAAAALIDPTVISGSEYSVEVETKGEYTAGQTLVDIQSVRGLSPNAFVAMDSDREKFLCLLRNTLEYFQ